MITLRPAQQRGLSKTNWLNSWHSFSFDQYRDPRYMGFQSLRVINQDIVQPGHGFGMHPHYDMEIITLVLRGSIVHQDSMGNKATIKPGEIQRMSAGTGITHSEFNGSDKDELELLQIWIIPNRGGLTPSYQQNEFDADNSWQLLGSTDGQQHSIIIHQDVLLYLGQFDQQLKSIDYPIAENRHVWLQMISGAMDVNNQRLTAGDGAAISNEKTLQFAVAQSAKFLLFDLAEFR
jgi:redox-sensitive bicupin YhaK (pirin superfamily)